MKKILVVFALFAAMFLMISCGSGSKTSGNTDTGDTATDNEPGEGDTEPTETPDSDNSDITPDVGDSAPDNGDSTPDNDADSGDTVPDSDNEEPVNENPDNLPECSPTSATPCIDSETGLIWSGKSAEKMHWADAIDYCKNINEGGYNDWRLPSISVLETLVKECGNSGYSNGECSKFGDIVFFWSSNTGNAEATIAYGVYFYNGARQTKNVDESFNARCVRRETYTRKAACSEIPEHTEWNTVSEITQTWDWDQMWKPTLNSHYSESPSTTQCQFKCGENLFWSEYNSTCVDYDTSECAPEDIIIKAEKITNYSQEEIQEKINYYHDMNRSQCYGSVTEKEKFDTQGNLCIEDECNIGPNDIAQGAGAVWIDNLPFLVRDLAPNGLPAPGDTIYYRKVEQLNKGNLTDLTITRNLLTFYVKDIPTASCFSQNNAIDGVSTITMSIGNGYYNGCYLGNQQISPSDIIATKNIQPKITETNFKTACKKVPNSSFYQPDEKCSTTITEFAWLENIVQYLYDKSGLTWRSITIQNTKIEKDVDNNIFRMYFSVDGQYFWAVELPNAKRCLDECYGIEGCEVSINPSADISNGCVVQEP